MPILAIIHNQIYGFICPNCGNEFTVPWYVNFITPHFFKVKLLKCPQCKKFGWAETIKKRNMKKMYINKEE